jgi:hypothetical protein
MYFVTLTEAAGEVEKEAAALAPVFGVSPYDVRGWLLGVLPRTILQAPAESTALEAAAKLRARRHGVLVIDSRDVVPGSEMVQMHRFVLGEREIVPNDDMWDRLAYDEIAVVVVVARRIDVVRRKVEHAFEPKAVGRPHAPRYAQPEQHTAFEHVYDRVAYLFPRRAELLRRPWMLHEREAQYMSLGARMQPTQRANFLVALEILRARAPGAIFDDRFVTSPRTIANVTQVTGHDSPKPDPTNFAVEVLVHALATWLGASHGGPYR